MTDEEASWHAIYFREKPAGADGIPIFETSISYAGDAETLTPSESGKVAAFFRQMATIYEARSVAEEYEA